MFALRLAQAFGEPPGSPAALLAAVREFCLDPVPGRPGHSLFGRC